MELKDLEIYKLSRIISGNAWVIFDSLNWEDKRTMGYQWISSIDSVGANIAEGFGRYHYLDKNKFNYNARGSLLEAIHWTNLLKERGKIDNKSYTSLRKKLTQLNKQLNKYISTTKQQNKK